jgi:hypothetical protein
MCALGNAAGLRANIPEADLAFRGQSRSSGQAADRQEHGTLDQFSSRTPI